jgi:uncharacterized protein YjbI with pentapeptide repeats
MEKEDSQSGSQDKQPGRKFSPKQYDMLMRCSKKRDMTEWNDWRKKHEDEEILLEGAKLEGAYLKNAMLHRVHLENANLRDAHLENVDLNRAHLENADLRGARLRNAILHETHLENAWLINDAHLEYAKLNEAHLENAKLELAHLEYTNLGGAHLEGAYLQKVHLKGADLDGAHLEGANLLEAHLENAKLWGAYIRGADFSGAFLQGTNCDNAIVDGETLIGDCDVDRNTNFEGVGLGSARIDSATRQLLEYNIRKNNWSLWYNRLWSRNWFTKIISAPLVPLKWILVRPFWFISDYGLSTIRILITFALLALAYAVVYFCCPGCVYIYGEEVQFVSFLHATYFSVVTMTTLGFGDIAANPKSTLGLLLLMSQVILGYVLLGALVTRFAVLFTAGGPAGKFTGKIKS